MENEEIVHYYHHEFQAPIATVKGCLGIVDMLINEIKIEMAIALEKNHLTITQKDRILIMELKIKELNMWKELAVAELEKVSKLARQKMNI